MNRDRKVFNHRKNKFKDLLNFITAASKSLDFDGFRIFSKNYGHFCKQFLIYQCKTTETNFTSFVKGYLFMFPGKFQKDTENAFLIFYIYLLISTNQGKFSVENSKIDRKRFHRAKNFNQAFSREKR